MALDVDPNGALGQVPGLAYACFALDPLTGDLALPVRIIRGADAVIQRIRVRFRWFLGEWFLDTRQGVPYYRDVLVKSPDQILISSIFRAVLRSVPGVKAVRSFQASLEPATRTLTVDFEALLDDGSVVRADTEPFIIG